MKLDKTTQREVYFPRSVVEIIITDTREMVVLTPATGALTNEEFE